MSYFVVQDWMIKNLKLKGLERDIYAIIYGITQDKESKFYGSLKYLSENTGYSKQSVIEAIKKLIEKNLIIKHENEINNIKNVRYSINFTTSQESLPNNINNNKTNTFLNNKLFKNNNITKSGIDLYTNCINLIDEFCYIHKEPYLRENLIKYLNFRLEVKDKPLYKNMWKGLLEKLQTSFNESAENVKYQDIISVSLCKGYLTFYPITTDKYKNQYIPDNNIHWKDDYDLDENNYKQSTEKF